MAQAFNAQLPQPDFGRIAQIHVELSTELEKCRNIPAVYQGNEILQALQQLQGSIGGLQNNIGGLRNDISGLRNDVDGLRNGMDELRNDVGKLRNDVGDLQNGMGDLQGEIGTIKTRLRAIDANNIARIANSRITRPDSDLIPLVGVLTNQPIPNSPQDAEAIRSMSAASANAFLQSLDQSTEGTLAAKRRRIRAAFGLLPEPV